MQNNFTTVDHFQEESESRNLLFFSLYSKKNWTTLNTAPDVVRIGLIVRVRDILRHRRLILSEIVNP